MSLAIGAIGSLFKIESDSSAGQYNTIPETHRITAPNIRFDLIDVTSHDSVGGFREFLPGLADGENAAFEYFFVPSNTIHIQLRTDALARTLKSFKIVFTGGTNNTITFNGYLVGNQPNANVGDALRASGNVKVTGQPTWS